MVLTCIKLRNVFILVSCGVEFYFGSDRVWKPEPWPSKLSGTDKGEQMFTVAFYNIGIERFNKNISFIYYVQDCTVSIRRRVNNVKVFL